mmetsp:Transcript_3708/g.15414  ORF Transcript_3708/g.15414 Transcript_3708/m.15414 type:complete len:278 (-) Transcript_3708:7364-8197(-)
MEGIRCAYWLCPSDVGGRICHRPSEAGRVGHGGVICGFGGQPFARQRPSQPERPRPLGAGPRSARSRGGQVRPRGASVAAGAAAAGHSGVLLGRGHGVRRLRIPHRRRHRGHGLPGGRRCGRRPRPHRRLCWQSRLCTGGPERTWRGRGGLYRPAGRLVEQLCRPQPVAGRGSGRIGLLGSAAASKRDDVPGARGQRQLVLLGAGGRARGLGAAGRPARLGSGRRTGAPAVARPLRAPARRGGAPGGVWLVRRTGAGRGGSLSPASHRLGRLRRRHR